VVQVPRQQEIIEKIQEKEPTRPLLTLKESLELRKNCPTCKLDDLDNIPCQECINTRGNLVNDDQVPQLLLNTISEITGEYKYTSPIMVALKIPEEELVEYAAHLEIPVTYSMSKLQIVDAIYDYIRKEAKKIKRICTRDYRI